LQQYKIGVAANLQPIALRLLDLCGAGGDRVKMKDLRACVKPQATLYRDIVQAAKIAVD